MSLFAFPIRPNYLVRVFVLLLSLMSLERAHAQPTIVSTVPPTGASGVPVSAAVVLTFSEAMNTSVTLAYLYDSTTLELLPASLSWSAGNTVLTCTPTAAFPANRTIWWTVMNGQNPAGVPLGGYTGGTFTTAPAGQLTLTNAIWSGEVFAFDVISPAGQTLTVEYSSTLRSNQWQTLLTTNSPAGRVHIADTHPSTNRYLFYRARTGS
jgi:methionine-rich copper-binding protein CopC